LASSIALADRRHTDLFQECPRRDMPDC
jgi:hypothetical protein